MSSGAISQPYFAEFPTGYVVSGRVTSGGAAVAGVTVSLTGAATQSTSTDINGDYRFTGVFDGAYTITPSQVDYTFTPQRINVTVSGADVSGQNFAATAIGYSVSGKVTSGGAAVAGVTVSLTGAATKSTTTDGNGNYSFSGLVNGVYTVSASMAGYTITPQSYTFNINGANVSGKDFTATLITYSISGKVSIDGAGLSGVSVNLTGAATRSTTTDGNGNYTFSGLVNGAYTITPSKTGYAFSPPTINTNVNGADVSGQNFTGTLITYSISGKVSINGAGLSGVSVNLTGGVTKSTTTDGNGNYSFSGLLDGAYTVTPSKSGYTMAPQSRSVSVSGADVAGQDFIAALPTYSISGRVTTVGYAFPGVTVSLTGGATKSTTTDGNGNYSFTGISDGAYIITPSKIGYSFTPSSINVNVSGADVVGQDFTAPLGAATLLSPSGTISTSTPAYSWNAVPGSTWYYLYVNDSTGTRITTWYSASQAGCAGGTGTCSIEPGTVLAPGSATWWVQSYGASGNGPWSNSMSFTVPPGQATLISPSGTISTSTPAYSWNAVPGSTWYYLYVNDSKGTRITSWYSASQAGCAGGTGTCTVSPGTVLATGSGVWWVQTYGSNGYGPWSNSMAFTVPAPPSPGKVTLVSPSGTISTATPLYTWNADPNSTWYLLYVNDSTGNKISNWYSASQAGCSGGTGTCSIEPGTVLAPGSATWWIQSYGAAGNGPWSNGMTFTVPPGQATLISPSGTISTATPSYSWNAVPGSTWYYLYVNDNTGTRITHWYSASEAGCSEGTGTCAVSPGTLLATGSGVWWVQTYGPNGYGPWSNSMAFTVSP
jgi:inhibitor of cysteine peptidase